MNAADMHRIRLSLPYYETEGWSATVLCVGAAYQDGPRDEALLATLPAGLKLQQTGALPRRLCRLFGIGNLGLRSFLHVFFASLRLIRKERPALILFSTTQFALFPQARLWQMLFGIPCVIDLHDPWVTDAYDKPGAPPPPGGWKYRVASAFAKTLEGFSFRRLAGMIAVSQVYLQDLRARYPWFAQIPSLVLGFGASEGDLAAARALYPPTAHPTTQEKPAAEGAPLVHLVYTGAAGPSLHRILPEFLAGVALFKQQKPAAAARLRIHFVGTSYVAPGKGAPCILPLAEALGIASLVTEIPHRVGHLECLARQCGAEALLLPGSVDPAYSPSKLYPYFLSGRPILALAPAESVLAKLLAQLSCSRFIPLSLDTPQGACAELVASALTDLLEGRPLEALEQRNLAHFTREFLAPSLVHKQCAFFNTLLSSATALPQQ